MATENTRYARTGELSEWLATAGRIHFIGICGAGMRALARICHDRGYTVTGSDDDPVGEGGLALSLAGIQVLSPSKDGAIMTADMAVYSVAVGKDHPELLVARSRAIPTVSRADLLAALLAGHRERIGVAGTHGKSTVTAAVGSILSQAGRRPTVVAGAPISPLYDGYIPGDDDLAVFEACEYYDSFLSFSPTVAVLTNAEWDHPDYFKTPEAAASSFLSYLSLPSVRLAVLSGDDPTARSLTGLLSVPYVTFGLSAGCDITAKDVTYTEGGSRFFLYTFGSLVGEVTLRIPGEHNIENALAAVGAALAAGVDAPEIIRALSRFGGVGRRTEYRGRREGVDYYDDYAHHPTEIRAALKALRPKHGRLFTVFQPHTYTRTAELFSGLGEALLLADFPILVDIYAAREENTVGASSRALAKASGGIFIETPEEAARYLLSVTRPGDRVVVMGAGDVGLRFFTGPLAFTGD